MTITVSPPPRSRAPVSPPPRQRTPVTQVSPPPRPRPSALTATIEDALPLPPLMRTHNGYAASATDTPDPRFAPLVIVMNPLWRKAMPPWIKHRLDEALKWTPETVAGEMHLRTPAYLTEWALRNYLDKALLADDVFDALHVYVMAHADGWNDCARSIITVAPSGKITVDMTKASGPFYLDGVLAIEIHYADRLRDISG